MNKLFNVYSLFFLISAAILFIYPHTTVTAANDPAGKFVLTTNTDNVSTGENLEVTINLNTGENEVTSYIANLTYPIDKLTFESINTESSPFNMALEAKGENGQINIIRGSIKPLTGEILIGTVRFKAKKDTNSNEVTITNNSAILNTDNQNILPESTVQNNSQPSTSNNSTEEVPQNQTESTNLLSYVSGFIVSLRNFFNSFFK